MTNLTQLTEIVRVWTDLFTTHSMHAWTRYVKASGLSMPQFGILMNLFYRHTCGVSDLSEHMDISAAAASQLVDKLVHSGLLERIEAPNDRRAKVLSLSPEGLGMIETGIKARSVWVDDLVAALNPDEYEVVATALSLLTRAASRLDHNKTEKPT